MGMTAQSPLGQINSYRTSWPASGVCLCGPRQVCGVCGNSANPPLLSLPHLLFSSPSKGGTMDKELEDQSDAGATAMASMVASFHDELIARGIHPKLAGELDIEFLIAAATPKPEPPKIVESKPPQKKVPTNNV